MEITGKPIVKSVSTMDAWGNLFTGSGIQERDPGAHNIVTQEDLLDEVTISDLYDNDGLCARIVNLIVEDSLRKWFTIDGDDKRNVQNVFDEINFKRELTRLLEWSRAYGGSVMFLGLNDGEKLPVYPVNYRNLKSLNFVRVFDRYRVTKTILNNDITSVNYLKPETYQIAPVNGSPFTCHASRLIIKDGIDCNDNKRTANMGWGLSTFQGIFDKMAKMGISFNSVSQILSTFVQDYIQIDGLHSLVASGQEDIVKRRLALLDLSKSMINTILLDSKETFGRSISSISGVSDAIDRLMIYVSACTGIPVTRLWGRSPAGLNATGESDIKNWYDTCDSYRTDEISPVLEQIISIIFQCREQNPGGKEPEAWYIEYPPLQQLSEKEIAELYKITADADDIYIRNGVLTPKEVKDFRFTGEDYNAGEIHGLEVDDARDTPPDPVE